MKRTAALNGRRQAILMPAILLTAALLRLVWPGEAPPGMHVDAAANAWTANCLRETGQDWRGEPWPILYSRGFGENQTTLYYYALLPFQTVGGMSPTTTRLPAAIAGVASVYLLFWIGRRWFGFTVGWVSAALLAITPWHLLLSRWGHESGLVPLLTVAPLAALIASGLPLGGAGAERPSPRGALLAGVLVGLCCYGYYAMRLFLPLLLLAAVAVNPVGWWRTVRCRRGAIAVALLALGLAATLGPLVYAHLTDPEIVKRGRVMLLWEPSDPWAVKLSAIASRYIGHFGPDFLFAGGDRFPLHSLPGSGPLAWSVAPLILLGGVFVLREARSSIAVRVLLVWLLLYPIGDLFTHHPSLHILRSGPGVTGWVLLAGFGAVRGARLLSRYRPQVAAVAVIVLGLAVGLESGRFLITFFGDYSRRAETRWLFNADLLAASRWLRPRLDEVDAVFFSTSDSAALRQPFIITLVGLDYDPRRWFRDQREFQPRPDTDLCKRYGKVHFLFDESDRARVERLERNGRIDRVIFVLRPGEWTDRDPVHRVRHPDGRVAFEIYDEQL